jgi:predicted nucleic acid-binding protein
LIMCIVVDTNVVASVFNPASANHDEFEPVFRWILRGKGKLVYGGSTYWREVFERMPKYGALILELKRGGKCVVLDRNAVDEAERRVQDAEPSADFDDAHLVAIFDVSGCMLLCSDDARADRFVKDRELYERRTPPRIYRLAEHAHLLCDDNIAACCKPVERLAGVARAEIMGMLEHE